ncbi:farnesol dehydrogenase isoform X1 [Dendroctonus ponderosae]|uniref:farnesol dehydrogenase isoform X1 n=1 Tax=Dendroctonus ponderosae TaxID=77166 RepID=UPI002035BA68|nr:farnesol dehydrogenase isoform X1 [Dendroctonus ponderosae]
MMANLERFSGKVAVVTGASAGIGVAIVQALVKHGIIVAGLARRAHRIVSMAEELKDEPGKLYAYKCDMTVEDEIVSTFKEIINELGDIHILVNNAGLMLETDLINGDTEMWKKCFDTNVIALCIATREAIQNMKTKGTRGHIIHLNSIAGHEIMNFPKTNVYGASKYAVTALTMTLINDLANEELPIKVTSISPGYVKTEFQAVAGLSKSMLPKVGLNSVDVAEAVIYALSTRPHVNVSEITIRPLHE